MLKRHAPATERNRTPILTVLEAELPAEGTVIEIASGTGEHAAYFAPRLPGRAWQPTDLDAENLASINAWCEEAQCPQLLSAQVLDASDTQWPEQLPAFDSPVSAIVCINMIHISPWTSCEGLLAGAEQLLPNRGVLYLYGPFMRGGEHTAPSNEAFNQQLKQRNPHWGLRNLESVLALAETHQLTCRRVVEMPANNLSVVLEKRARLND